MGILRRIQIIALLALAVASPAYLVSFKLGWAPQSASTFASMVIIFSLLMVVELVWSVARAIRGTLAPAVAVGRALLLGGALAFYLGGTANWAFGLQGFMVLSERETMPLFGGHGMEALEAGPLGDPSELGITIQLVGVDLLRMPDGSFGPESRIRVRGRDGKVVPLTLRPDRSGQVGPLRFLQGIFGYAPRVVVLTETETLMDEQVPFVTENDYGLGMSFNQLIHIEGTTLAVEAEIDLGPLDERGRGHPAMFVRVLDGEEEIGSGRLRPGHFADVAGGYRVGFAGLDKWAEILIARRTYAEPMLVGLGVAPLGALVWGGASVRRRLRRRREPSSESS